MNRIVISRQVTQALTACNLLDRYIEDTVYGSKKFDPETVLSFIISIDESTQTIKKELTNG